MRAKRLIAALLLATVLLLLLTSCGGVRRYGARLEREGYLVRYYEEGSAAPTFLHTDLSSRLSASGPKGEVLDILIFKEKEKAEEYYESIRKKYEALPSMTAEIKGKTVFFGSSAAYRIAK